MPITPPLWAVILEAADKDPLRAQEIESNLSAEWWYRYATYLRAKGEAAKHRVD